jgi:hypothetical protein
MRYLEEELAELLRALQLQDRQARAVAARLGWDGKGTCTLQVAATAEGYSRERVRQLEDRVRAQARTVEASVAATTTAIELIEERAPVPRDAAATELLLAGLSRRRFDVSGLLSAAEVLGIEHTLVERAGTVRVDSGLPQELAA